MKRGSRNWKKTIGRRGSQRCRWKTRKEKMRRRMKKAEMRKKK